MVEFTVDFVEIRGQVDTGGTELEFPVGTLIAALVEYELSHTELVSVGLGEIIHTPLVRILAAILLGDRRGDELCIRLATALSVRHRKRKFLLFCDFLCHCCTSVK